MTPPVLIVYPIRYIYYLYLMRYIVNIYPIR